MPQNQDPLFDEEPQGIVSRLLPPLVLMCAFGGFIALAIYAYKAGTQSVNDGELMVIEADKSPMKEKPEDPGGMQFPNQDKSVFETFSAGGEPPKVERVLPTPEEPISPKEAETSEPTTWVNEKLATNNAPEAKPAAPAGAEQVFGDEAAAPAAPVVEEKPAPMVKNVQEELGKQAVAEAPVAEVAKPVELTPKTTAKKVELQERTVTMKDELAASKAESKAKADAKAEAASKAADKVIEKAVEAEKPAAKPATKPKTTGGKGLVQLGAYRSEAEAKGDFAKMQKKHPALAGKSPTINRADLGDKGIFFRLRVATDDPKALCASLSGQACMVVK